MSLTSMITIYSACLFLMVEHGQSVVRFFCELIVKF